MIRLYVTKEAQEIIQKKIRWHFWIFRPVIMLIEFGEGSNTLNEDEIIAKSVINSKEINVYKNNTKYSLSKDTTNSMKLMPIVKSARRLPEHYLKKVIQTSKFVLIPHIKMILYENEIEQWLLDIGEEGLALFADGVLVSGMRKGVPSD